MRSFGRSSEELLVNVEYQIDIFFMNISVEMALIGSKYWAIQAKTDNLTAKVLRPKISETYILVVKKNKLFIC